MTGDVIHGHNSAAPQLYFSFSPSSSLLSLHFSLLFGYAG